LAIAPRRLFIASLSALAAGLALAFSRDDGSENPDDSLQHLEALRYDVVA